MRVYHKVLIRLRLQHGLSQEELADLAGIGRQTVVRIEQGQANPRGATVRKLARALGVKTRDLVDLSSTPD